MWRVQQRQQALMGRGFGADSKNRQEQKRHVLQPAGHALSQLIAVNGNVRWRPSSSWQHTVLCVVREGGCASFLYFVRLRIHLLMPALSVALRHWTTGASDSLVQTQRIV